MDATNQSQVTKHRLHSLMRAQAWWFLLVFIVCGVMAVFAWKPGLFYSLGINTYGRWFHDTFAILASNDAAAYGIDVYLPNPLDYFHRPHVYSNWWLYLGSFGLTRSDTVWLSITLDAMFLISAIIFLRPKTRGEMLWYLAVLLSPPVLLAINRANNDLVVFLVLFALPAILKSPSRLVRLCAPFLIAVATGLKYYPLAAAGLLLLGNDWKELRARSVIFGLLMLLVTVSLAEDLLRFGKIAPHTEGLITFGATAIPMTLGSAWKGWPVVTWVLGAVIFLGLYRGAKVASESEPDEEELRFLLGAMLLAACFWLGMNHGYRWVFALWLAPYLWRERQRKLPGSETRRLVRLSGVLLIAVLWTDSLIAWVLNRFLEMVPIETLQRWANWAYVVEQPVTWAFFLCLLTFLARYLKGRITLGREVWKRC